MILKLIDNKIRRAFSNSALQYEALTGLHKEIGRELIHKVSLDVGLDVGMVPIPSLKILDVGMGTGWLTRRVKSFFPEALVLGLDFSDGMIDAARQHQDNFQIIQADANELPFKNECFDLIVSNLAYQWIDDLTGAFRRSHAILKRGGRFSFTMFGRATFQELFVAFEHSLEKCVHEKKQDFPVRRLAGQKDIEAAMKRAGFVDVNVDFERIKVRFMDMMDLLQWTKNIGANNLEKNIYVGKDLLLRANDYYNMHFKDAFGITATFEVIWASGRK